MYEVLDKGVCRLENLTGKVLKTTVNISRLKTFCSEPCRSPMVEGLSSAISAEATGVISTSAGVGPSPAPDLNTKQV